MVARFESVSFPGINERATPGRLLLLRPRLLHSHTWRSHFCTHQVAEEAKGCWFGEGGGVLFFQPKNPDVKRVCFLRSEDIAWYCVKFKISQEKFDKMALTSLIFSNPSKAPRDNCGERKSMLVPLQLSKSLLKSGEISEIVTAKSAWGPDMKKIPQNSENSARSKWCYRRASAPSPTPGLSREHPQPRGDSGGYRAAASPQPLAGIGWAKRKEKWNSNLPRARRI